MLPDEDDEERLEELPQDNQTPFTPADPTSQVVDNQMLAHQVKVRLSSTHPQTDTNLQKEELYDEGVSGAAEAQEPNVGNAVVGYHKSSSPTDDGNSDANEGKEGAGMATAKQREAARQNIRKAQAAWKSMDHRQHGLAQPEGRRRAKPGTKGEGEYYRIVVRPKDEFTTFRFQDVGDPGHLQRLAGRRSSGSWATHAWLISKEDAHVEGDKLVPDSQHTRELLQKLESEPRYERGDVFTAKDRRNVPEREKPTLAQQRAATRIRPSET